LIAETATLEAIMSCFDLEEFLPYQLAVLADQVSRGFSALYRQRYGLSVAEWRVVAHLGQSGMVSVREIHRRAMLGKSQVSRAASKLERNGYITKAANPADGRLVSLALTERGKAMLADLAPKAMAYEREILTALDGGTEFRASVRQLLELEGQFGR